MGETLFIRLGSQAEHKIHWLIKSNGEHEIIASGELANAAALTQLTAQSMSRDVVVFVPASDVAIKRLKVPSSSQRAMRLAAPYMLEEELAQDVEQLFFAFSDHKADQQEHNCFVAATAREQLVLWRQWLADAGIFCKIMIPDALALPFETGKSSAVMLGEQVLLRLGQWQVMAFEENAWPIVAKYLTESHKTEHPLLSYSPLPQVPTALPVEYLPEELPLAILATHYSRHFNLLQGEFQVKEKRSQVSKNWLWVAAMCGVALLLNVAAKSVELYQLANQATVLEEKIIARYQSTFPNTKRVRVATVKSQLRQKLAELGTGDSHAGFLPLLVKLEPALASVPELKPQTLKFDGKRQEVRMQALAKGYQYFEKLKVALEKAGLNVSLGAQNNQGEQISGSFSITDTSSRGRS
ncbi:general secretion pathway protein L [Colwellia chukchiensis]|uniref:Type II secretion system protein L n=1 Tax=Colwellia chukchiensis TaxID=641665 RepID=A0A1H7RAP2_9GAMM|nr:type II secretion system protein GspL [Colwellia chukchiensis]SEL57209.1 general secretion pathway protein L [Colwellia chukchiensis]